ncbi:staphyloferrin B biosynthesis decarboxylase SbnH [Rhizocola hellebori]|uniref:Staphyloferrin B biosynthesis decarboxylase SbnH n=1 Tax=Rhizocola hellebori TaxID=1392758 RepID=A0A8J3VE04_9ACTN|nr:alanine racemase [Rhizocola hellebori]GIH04074.1 staphyloferrin B biosynthesis decarboxylase SbnH [Rhizocola hellebori]
MGEYTYDLAILRERAARLRSALPAETILYAVKANGHPAVVATMAQACHGLDVASLGELSLALDAGAQRIVCSGPAKSAEFLDAAIAAGATINVESLTELHRLPRRATITLRVNRIHPSYGGSHAMTGGPSQFGLTPQDLPRALELAAGHDLAGFHLHAMSNCLSAQTYSEFIADAVGWALSSGVPLRQINLGGGLGVSYTSAEELDPAQLAIPRVDGVELIFEPGRWLAAHAGTYSAEVVDLKLSHGTWFAVIRGGMHQFRTPIAYGVNFPITVSQRDFWPHPWPRPGVRDVEVHVAGELCTPNDVLAHGLRVSELRVGDVLNFAKAGAYGWDISPHQYLRHPSPDFVILS